MNTDSPCYSHGHVRDVGAGARGVHLLPTGTLLALTPVTLSQLQKVGPSFASSGPKCCNSGNLHIFLDVV